MRKARIETIPGKRTQTLLVSHRLRDVVPGFSWDERELLRGFIAESGVELLTWCVMPRSFRMIVRTRYDVGSDHTGQNNPLVGAVKKIVIRFSHWRKYSGTESRRIWKDRYCATALKNQGEVLAGAASIDAYPVLAALADKAEDYCFCGFHHACQGDELARKGIRRILQDDPSSWPKIKRKYQRLLNHS